MRKTNFDQLDEFGTTVIPDLTQIRREILLVITSAQGRDKHAQTAWPYLTLYRSRIIFNDFA
jgi:hypothetical protein